MSDKDLPKTYTVEEIQRILHYKSPESVRRLIKNGRIPAIRVGGKYLVTEETLQRILRGEISADDEWPAIDLTLVKHSPVTFQPHYWFGVRHPIQKILGYPNSTLLAAETATEALLLQLDEMKALARAKYTEGLWRGKKGSDEGMNPDNDEPKNKLLVYTRQSQKGTTRKHKEPQEIKEANLFVLARKLGFRETSIILF